MKVAATSKYVVNAFSIRIFITYKAYIRLEFVETKGDGD